jgi:hypothetical protein
VARLLDDLQRWLQQVQRTHDAESGPLRIKYVAERETLKRLIAQVESGELYQDFVHAEPVEG